MQENLLQFIWQHRLYASQMPLQTIDGETILVIHPGQLNRHAGPDFLEAKIKIGSTLWVGHVEIHIKSSDWHKHLHQLNEAYSKLILHVVYEHDVEVATKSNTQFPTLVLKPYINENFVLAYQHLMQSQLFIPCKNLITQVPELRIQMQLTRMLAERLEDKTKDIVQLLKRSQNNWQEVFYIQLARSFGLHINQDAFEQLAKNTALAILSKHKHNLFQIEALLFGQAGFLDDYFDEPYPNQLQQEYIYLRKLYQLKPMPITQWKFLRLRPANFPTIRIAQFAQIIVQAHHLFSQVLAAESVQAIQQLFHVQVSEFWLNHYTFHEASKEQDKWLGKTFIQNIIINTIIPMMYIYGKLQGQTLLCDKANQLLDTLPAEQNSIVEGWKQMGIQVQTAAQTQGILQLKKNYCDAKRCLECGIGYVILKN